MKFDYQDLVASSVKGMRLYETPNGHHYPSITTVLGQTMPEDKAAALKKWQTALGPLADKKSKEATDKGTAVHLMVERYLKNEELIQGNEKIDNSVISAFNALKLKLNKIQEVWGLEVALFSDELGVAGRCDCIGVYKDKPCIIDFKTSSKIKSSKDIEDYKLQLTAYALMHNEMFDTAITDGVILMTSEAGFPQEFLVDLFDYVEPLVERIESFYQKLSSTL